MRLKAVILECFRGYNSKIRIEIDKDLTAFIGRNDVGKSTIMEALDIFFNSTSKIQQNDLCIHAPSPKTLIGCVFDDLPPSIILDETSRTTLANEYLLNESGDLEIYKRYSMDLKTPKESIYILAKHPIMEGYNSLLELKNQELKRIITSRGINTETIDLRSNVSMRRNIWENESELDFELKEIPVAKEDSKTIWDQLVTYLPTYALFKSDRGSSDEDSEVQDPMKMAISMALAEVSAQLETIKNQVKDKAIETANRTLEKLKEMDSNLASQLSPEFKNEPKWDNIFKMTLNCDDDIPINKRGSGIRRLILLNFFRAEAERRQSQGQTPSIIYAIEEPETSQHPNYQELLINALLNLGKGNNTQVILTTHVPALGGLLPLESLRFIQKHGDSSITVDANNEDVYQKIASTLGVLPEKEISQARGFVFVEGYADVIFLRHLAKALKDNGSVTHTLEEKGIIALITGGCGNLKHWVNLNIIKHLNKPWAVFLDSDIGGPDISNIELKRKQIKDFRDSGIMAFLTKKREAENYLHPNAVLRKSRKVVTFGPTDDVKKIINAATNTRQIRVLETYWVEMTAAEILEQDKYCDDQNVERHELLEMVTELLKLTN